MAGRPTMKVEMLPADASETDNSFIRDLVSGLRRRGVEVFGYRFWSPSSEAEVIHLHWIEKVVQSGRRGRSALLAVIALAVLAWKCARHRRRGGRVVWTVHNLRPHESVRGVRGWAWRLLMPVVYRSITDVILMARYLRDELTLHVSLAPDCRFHVMPHPRYEEALAAPPADARTSGRPFVVGVFGQIRRYKGIEEIVRAFAAHLETEPDTPDTLVVCGDGDRELVAELRTLAGRHPRNIVLDIGAMTDAAFFGKLRQVDAVLFNFRSITNSGSMMAALSAARPCIAPRLPLTEELATTFGRDWVRNFDAPLEASELGRLLAAVRDHPPAGRPDTDDLSFDRFVERHAAAYGI